MPPCNHGYRRRYASLYISPSSSLEHDHLFIVAPFPIPSPTFSRNAPTKNKKKKSKQKRCNCKRISSRACHNADTLSLLPLLGLNRPAMPRNDDSAAAPSKRKRSVMTRLSYFIMSFLFFCFCKPRTLVIKFPI